MDEEKIKHYILESRKHGLSDDHIRTNLLSVGWDPKMVDSVFVQGNFAEPQQGAGVSIAAKLQRSDPVVPPNSIAAMPPGVSEMLGAQGQKKSSTKTLAIAAIIILVLAGGGWAIFSYAKNSPTRVWESFLSQLVSAKSNGAKHSTSQVKFTDSIGNGQQVSTNFESVSDSDLSHPDNPLLESNLSGQFSMGAEAFSVKDIKLRLIGKVVYVNVSNIPFVSTYAADYGGWIKIDTNNLPAEYKSILSGKLQNQSSITPDQVQKFLKDSKIVSGHNFIAKETVEGIPTYHYQIIVDKEAFKKFITDNLPKIDSSLPGALQVKYNFDFFNKFVDKTTLVQSDIWIGIGDKLMHKAAFELKFPSLIAQSLNAAQQGSRDAKRLADVRQLMTALELYFNDHSKYPPATNGLPALTTSYLGQIPLAPTPADGSCSAADNRYGYSQVGNGSSYALDFCLGKITGGYAAGKHTASPAGISGPNSTAGILGTSAGTNSDDILNGPQTGDLMINLGSSDSKIPPNIVAPPASLDLFQQLSSSANNLNSPSILNNTPNVPGTSGSNNTQVR